MSSLPESPATKSTEQETEAQATATVMSTAHAAPKPEDPLPVRQLQDDNSPVQPQSEPLSVAAKRKKDETRKTEITIIEFEALPVTPTLTPTTEGRIAELEDPVPTTGTTPTLDNNDVDTSSSYWELPPDTTASHTEDPTTPILESATQNPYWQTGPQEATEEPQPSGYWDIATVDSEPPNPYWEVHGNEENDAAPPPNSNTNNNGVDDSNGNTYWGLPSNTTMDSSTTTTTTTNDPIVDTDGSINVINLVLTEAPLLSGSLNDCHSPQDESCQGGVAAVSAFVRHLTRQQEPTLVFPKFEKSSQFVQVHPLGWSVNRLILQGLLGWTLLMSTPSLLLQNERDQYGSQRDLTYLQDARFPLLLTNVQVPPSSSWTEYQEYIHFDDTTGVALMSLANSDDPLNYDQIASVWGSLWIIADRNVANGCQDNKEDDADRMEERERQALFASYQDIYVNGPSSGTTTPQQQQQQQSTQCWIPIVMFDDSQPGNFQAFIDGIMQHPHPPALIIDVDKQAVEDYPVPMLVHVHVPVTSLETGHVRTTAPTTAISESTEMTTKPVWIHSFGRQDDMYYQHQLHLSNDSRPPRIQGITLIEESLEALPEAYKDDVYASHISYLRQQANQAIQNDPQVGFSTEFPVARAGNYRRCQGGECEIGNLFADALRWKANADVAFVSSGGLRGEGWPAGPVRISNIWSSLPFPNSLCTGVMAGVSLFQMLDYSISVSTFESEDTNDGERLLQVSGLQVVYNTQIERGSPRIISIKVWNQEEKDWLPVEQLSMYKFATDSFVCSAYDPYPDFLGANGNFTLENSGETPGTVGDELVQNSVAEYLAQLDEPYEASITGRLVNNTEVFDVLDLVRSDTTCPSDTYWSTVRKGCLQCPDSTHVEFSDEQLEFEGQIGVSGGIIPNQGSKASSIFNESNSNLTSTEVFEDKLQGRILLVNRELSNFTFTIRSIPSWLRFIATGAESSRFVVGGPSTLLTSGSSFALDFVVGDDSLKAGTATGSVAFDILGQSLYPRDSTAILACESYSTAVTFSVKLQLDPPHEENYLGDARFIGIGLMCVALMTAIFLAGFLLRNRTMMILKTMQPIFLVTVCGGVFIMAFTILPLSLDDQVLDEAGVDAACMAIPWTLSMGMTVIFSALFSKLWRVNKLFSTATFRKLVVKEKDVLAPFALLFSLNAVLLITFNVVDPLRSERLTVEGEEWKSYSACRAGTVGYALMYSISAVNMVALLLACYQAFRARNISGEFSESRSVGLAVGCWLQVLLVGFPALYLVDPDDIETSYFLQVGLLFVLCMSMMIIIFAPLVSMVWQYKKNPSAYHQRRASVGAIGTGSGRASVYVSGVGNSSTGPTAKSSIRKSFSEMATNAASAEFALPDTFDHNTSISSIGSGLDYRKAREPVKPFLLDDVPESFANEPDDEDVSLASAKIDLNSKVSLLDESQTEQEASDAVVAAFDDDSNNDSSVPFSEKSLDIMADDSDDSSLPFQGQNSVPPVKKKQLESTVREVLTGKSENLVEQISPVTMDRRREIMESSVRDLLTNGRTSLDDTSQDSSASIEQGSSSRLSGEASSAQDLATLPGRELMKAHFMKSKTTSANRRQMADRSDPGSQSLKWPTRRMPDKSDPLNNMSFTKRGDLQPLSEDHLNTSYAWEEPKGGSARDVLGHFTDESASSPKKKKKSTVKSAFSALNQSLSTLTFGGKTSDDGDEQGTFPKATTGEHGSLPMLDSFTKEGQESNGDGIERFSNEPATDVQELK